jgi:hypothetical protein
MGPSSEAFSAIEFAGERSCLLALTYCKADAKAGGAGNEYLSYLE